MSRIGVGIIGLSATGGWAARSHLPALRALDTQFQLNAVAGSSPERSRAAAAAFSIAHAADSVKSLVGHPDVELVVVAVKVPEHARLVEAALAAGKAVLCEWPLAVDQAEAELLAAGAGKAGVANFIGLQSRASTALQAVRALLDAGAIGEVLASNIVAGVGLPWDGTTDSQRTYLNRNASGATLLSIPFGHCLDTAGWMLGEFATWRAQTAVRRNQTLVLDEGTWIPTDVPDQIMLIGTTQGGVPSAIHYRGGLSAAGNFRWEINGTGGDILIVGKDGHLQYGLVDVSIAKPGETLAAVALPHDPLPAHARAVAGQYRAIHATMTGGEQTAPGFAHAAALHRILGQIAETGAAIA